MSSELKKAYRVETVRYVQYDERNRPELDSLCRYASDRSQTCSYMTSSILDRMQIVKKVFNPFPRTVREDVPEGAFVVFDGNSLFVMDAKLFHREFLENDPRGNGGGE